MLNLMKLENRIVLDGAAIGDAAEHQADQADAAAHLDDVPTSLPDHGIDAADSIVAEAAALLSGSEAHQVGLDVVLISDRLPDCHDLASAADPGAKVIVYDGNTATTADLLAQVVQLSRDSGAPIHSVTLMSHGGSGFFTLGKEVVNADTLVSQENSWEDLGEVMTADAQIQLYGCNVTAGESGAGQALLNDLADITGADVYASNDTTGTGGDWVLESNSESAPEMIAHLDVSMLKEYQGVLQDDIRFQATNTLLTSEDAFSSNPIILYVRNGITPEQLQATINDSVNPDSVLPNNSSISLYYDKPYTPTGSQANRLMDTSVISTEWTTRPKPTSFIQA